MFASRGQFADQRVAFSVRQNRTVADEWRDTSVVRGADGKRRCGWCVSDPDNLAYHDDEWGRPVTDDVRLYEKLCLEGFQSGLSWLTILRKREHFREAFAGFDPERVARFGKRDVNRLLRDAGIVRHRGKIEATIANARATLEIQERSGSLAALVWSFEPPPRARPVPERLGDLAAVTAESKALAAALRRFGFRFVGPTTAYAAMQSLGLVNDHLQGCHVRVPCNRLRQATVVPSL
jgi:DNA-3-methyladenine glycosylase I